MFQLCELLTATISHQIKPFIIQYSLYTTSITQHSTQPKRKSLQTRFHSRYIDKLKNFKTTNLQYYNKKSQTECGNIRKASNRKKTLTGITDLQSEFFWAT